MSQPPFGCVRTDEYESNILSEIQPPFGYARTLDLDHDGLKNPVSQPPFGCAHIEDAVMDIIRLAMSQPPFGCKGAIIPHPRPEGKPRRRSNPIGLSTTGNRKLCRHLPRYVSQRGRVPTAFRL